MCNFLCYWFLHVGLLLLLSRCSAFSHLSQSELDKYFLLTHNYDTSLEAWFQQQAIQGTSRVKICTTELSVGGRGAFWCSKIQAKRGDILAVIPQETIITYSNSKLVEPDEVEGLLSVASWPTIITWLCLRAQSMDSMKPWVESFVGPEMPRPLQFYSSQDLEALAKEATVLIEEVEKAIKARYETFQNDYQCLQDWTSQKGRPEIPKSEFGRLYSIVVSRTAALGPSYQGDRGVIPLHDMINHPPENVPHNVELFTIGDIRKMIDSEEHVQRLLKSVIDLEQTPAVLVDKDVVLVARGDIHFGDELFLCYKDRKSSPTDQDRMWSLIQYGFVVR